MLLGLRSLRFKGCGALQFNQGSFFCEAFELQQRARIALGIRFTVQASGFRLCQKLIITALLLPYTELYYN